MAAAAKEFEAGMGEEQNRPDPNHGPYTSPGRPEKAAMGAPFRRRRATMAFLLAAAAAAPPRAVEHALREAALLEARPAAVVRPVWWRQGCGMSLRHCEAEQESVEVVHLRFRPPLRVGELWRFAATAQICETSAASS